MNPSHLPEIILWILSPLSTKKITQITPSMGTPCNAPTNALWGDGRGCVGPKIAQRVVNELKDKAHTVMAMGGAVPSDAAELAEVIEPGSSAAPRPAPGPARRRGPPPPPAPRTAPPDVPLIRAFPSRRGAPDLGAGD